MFEKRKRKEENAHELVMELARKRFDKGDLKGALAMMRVADILEEEVRSWID